MTKKTFSLEDNVFLQNSIMVIGLILSAVGINAFLTPANLLSGGLTGICVMLNNLFGINQGVASFLMNIPIFILSKKYFGKRFLVLSFINMLLFSITLGVTQDLYKYVNINDTMLQCIYGGILNGVGMGLVFKAKAAAGGLDIIAAIIKVKFDIAMKNTFLMVNFFVICAGGFLFGPKLVMYTLISMYITSITMEISKDSFNKQKSILLISQKSEEIAQIIMQEMKSGVTFLEAEGAYTNDKKKLIYCIVSSNDLAKLKDLVYKIDLDAFISINNVEEVRGAGFKEKFL
ncbi:YitT family protein [Romboutsia sedimentorum]|uniref:YitT family protein n=1 Tax=Romboutsia sedimentorum TaxID=1368474 RepID=A0ABT7ED37_9FIRM|nr:YitT family protein [Romboutsia sedimentorum]MDK2564840.1 YitT family protein [Romboutsia sedimentorum]MDK2586985.1 YitT family protein [Romboutsia sedimentorum]